MTANRGESLGNCFVESLGRHVERMRGTVQIVVNPVCRKHQRLRSTDFIASPATGLDLRLIPARRDLR
jgi:hypothetical protein